MSRFAKGGVITTPTFPEGTVKVRLSGGRREYWEPELNRWVPVLTSAEAKAIGRQVLESLAAPEHELADDYERNDHQ